MFKKIIKFLGILLLVLLVILVVKTAFFTSKQMNVNTVEPIEIASKSVQNLSKALTFKTVSNKDISKIDSLEFIAYHAFIDSAYPLVAANLVKQDFDRYALLYEWNGKDPTLQPIILMAHQDVVPVVEKNWVVPPFSGKIDGTYIWGRGSWDDKGSMIVILESVEKMLSEGFIPERSIYLVFGADEEIYGLGAKSVADELQKRGIRVAMVLDEGMVIAEGSVPMISQPVALVALSEKGKMTVEMNCKCEGGHSSMPQNETTISVLSDAILQLTKHQPAPQFTQPVVEFIRYLGPETSWPARIVFANRWLLGGILKGIYISSPAGNAMLRTTTAPTIVKSGIQDNVLPSEGVATVNFRILPGDNSSKIMERISKYVDEKRITFKPVGNIKEPSKVSPVDGKQFDLLHRTVKECFENTIVAPTLMIGGTDSYQFSNISDAIFRFAPYQITSEELAKNHGDNERLKIESYKAMINFYYRLIKNVQSDL